MGSKDIINGQKAMENTMFWKGFPQHFLKNWDPLFHSQHLIPRHFIFFYIVKLCWIYLFIYFYFIFLMFIGVPNSKILGMSRYQSGIFNKWKTLFFLKTFLTILFKLNFGSCMTFCHSHAPILCEPNGMPRVEYDNN